MGFGSVDIGVGTWALPNYRSTSFIRTDERLLPFYFIDDTDGQQG